ncbi:MAG: hypothetical protein BMS9Abin11_1334 [Gammaproteobacteria bacterium]|nr:MAG: hypothetical protein BMS9Abin11_1334 [Gammaproteobacteria bacterium]
MEPKQEVGTDMQGCISVVEAKDDIQDVLVSREHRDVWSDWPRATSRNPGQLFNSGFRFTPSGYAYCHTNRKKDSQMTQEGAYGSSCQAPGYGTVVIRVVALGTQFEPFSATHRLIRIRAVFASQFGMPGFKLTLKERHHETKSP